MNTEDQTNSLKAKKFLVWLFVVSSTIMFGGWTSYYLVFAAAKGKGHGLVLPDAFIYSSIAILLSSITLFLAKRAFNQQNYSRQRMLIGLTVILAFIFAILQFQAWGTLVSTGATMVNNNAAISFIYIVSGFHLLHILGGLGILVGAMLGSFKQISVERNRFRMEIASIFWHFLDILWIYLYVFLLLNR